MGIIRHSDNNNGGVDMNLPNDEADERDPSDVWRTALHEAGHAVVSVVVGWKVEVATILPEELGHGFLNNGHVQHSSPPTPAYVEQADGSFRSVTEEEVHRSLARADAAIALAGIAAEEVHLGGSPLHQNGEYLVIGDVDLLIKAHGLAVESAATSETLWRGHQRALRILRTRANHAATLALAEALLAQPRMEGVQVRRVIRAAQRQSRIRWYPRARVPA